MKSEKASESQCLNFSTLIEKSKFFNEVIRELLGAVEDVVKLLETKMVDKSHSCWKQIVERFRNRPIKNPRIMVVGAMKAGKSSLLNELLGCDLLPTDTDACTSYATLITYGKRKSVTLYFTNKTSKTIEIAKDITNLEQIEGLIVDKKRDASTDIDYIEITWPSELCKYHIDLVDSPGLDEGEQYDLRVMKAAREANAVIYLMNSSCAVRKTDIDNVNLIRKALSPGSKIFFVASRIDELDKLKCEKHPLKANEYREKALNKFFKSLCEKIGGPELLMIERKNCKYFCPLSLFGSQDAYFLGYRHQFEDKIQNFLKYQLEEVLWYYRNEILTTTGEIILILQATQKVETNSELWKSLSLNKLDKYLAGLKTRFIGCIQDNRILLEFSIQKVISNNIKKIIDDATETVVSNYSKCLNTTVLQGSDTCTEILQSCKREVSSRVKHVIDNYMVEFKIHMNSELMATFYSYLGNSVNFVFLGSILECALQELEWVDSMSISSIFGFFRNIIPFFFQSSVVISREYIFSTCKQVAESLSGSKMRSKYVDSICALFEKMVNEKWFNSIQERIQEFKQMVDACGTLSKETNINSLLTIIYKYQFEVMNRTSRRYEYFYLNLPSEPSSLCPDKICSFKIQKRDGTFSRIKRILLTTKTPAENMSLYVSELRKVVCTSLVQLEDCCLEENANQHILLLVFPWKKHTLASLFQNQQISSLTLSQKIAICCNICSGLQILRSHNLEHGHLCPENVLLTQKNEASLSDFRLSNYYVFQKQQKQSVFDPCTNKNDIYYLGLIIWSLWEERIPKVEELIDSKPPQINRKSSHFLPKHISRRVCENIQSIIQNCLKEDISATNVLKDLQKLSDDISSSYKQSISEKILSSRSKLHTSMTMYYNYKDISLISEQHFNEFVEPKFIAQRLAASISRHKMSQRVTVSLVFTNISFWNNWKKLAKATQFFMKNSFGMMHVGVCLNSCILHWFEHSLVQIEDLKSSNSSPLVVELKSVDFLEENWIEGVANIIAHYNAYETYVSTSKNCHHFVFDVLKKIPGAIEEYFNLRTGKSHLGRALQSLEANGNLSLDNFQCPFTKEQISVTCHQDVDNYVKKHGFTKLQQKYCDLFKMLQAIDRGYWLHHKGTEKKKDHQGCCPSPDGCPFGDPTQSIFSLEFDGKSINLPDISVNVQTKPPLVVLCLDASTGLRSVILMCILKYVATKLVRSEQKNIILDSAITHTFVNLIDVFAGSSIGGVIASGLANHTFSLQNTGPLLHEIIQLYGVSVGKYASQNSRNTAENMFSLKSLFQEFICTEEKPHIPISAISKPTIVVSSASKDQKSYIPVLFTSYETEISNQDVETLGFAVVDSRKEKALVDVLRATCAHPSIFGSFEMNDIKYVDGSTCCYSPCIPVAIAAHSHFEKRKIIMISIGCGGSTPISNNRKIPPMRTNQSLSSLFSTPENSFKSHPSSVELPIVKEHLFDQEIGMHVRYVDDMASSYFEHYRNYYFRFDVSISDETINEIVSATSTTSSNEDIIPDVISLLAQKVESALDEQGAKLQQKIRELENTIRRLKKNELEGAHLSKSFMDASSLYLDNFSEKKIADVHELDSDGGFEMVEAEEEKKCNVQ